MQNEILPQMPQMHGLLQVPASSNNFSFANCQRVKKLTTHDIYRFKYEGTSLIVKVFPLNCQENYQLEVSQLTRINYPNVVKIIQHRQALDRSSNNQFDQSHIIIIKQATRGDLNEYLPKYGRMDQKMARTYFKKIIETFSALYKMKPIIIHPNLLATSILLDCDGQLQICGWSQLNLKSMSIKLQECIFACGQILVCMVTSFLPFYKKYCPTDTFYKLINQDDIHKFWNQLTKTVRKMDKQFQFSKSYKQLVEAIFLKKITNFDQILQFEWVKSLEVYSASQLKQTLDKNQKIKDQKFEIKRKQQIAIEEKRKKMIHDSQLSFGLHRSNDPNIQFINDYEFNIARVKQVPLSQNQFYSKIQSNAPHLFIASLNDFFKSEIEKETHFISEQLKLSSFKMQKKSNQVCIQLIFGLIMHEEEEQPLQQETIKVKLYVVLMKNSNKQFLVDIYVAQSGFNYFYTNLIFKCVQEKILFYEISKQNNKQQK